MNKKINNGMKIPVADEFKHLRTDFNNNSPLDTSKPTIHLCGVDTNFGYYVSKCPGMTYCNGSWPQSGANTNHCVPHDVYIDTGKTFRGGLFRT